MKCSISILISLFLACVNAQHWHQLPIRARGGEIYKRLNVEDATSSSTFTATLPLDHFDTSNNKTFTNYYYTDDSYFDQENGPIFLQMGGEGPVSGCSANDLHKSFKALALCVEHRFYGMSNPGRDIETIKYLSVEQNLADTAAIVEIVQKNLGGKARAVLNFGGSYSGATAAWFRDAYPNVTHAGFSSSGVVRALVNFTGFDETVATALGSRCSDNLKRLTLVFVSLSSTNKWNDAKRTMRASNLVDTHLGDDDFWYALADGAQMLDQYGHKASLCEFLDGAFATFEEENDDEMTLVKHYSDFIATSWGMDFMSGCFYDSECVRNESSTGMGRSWRWQKCSQLAYLQPGYHGSLRYEKLTLDRLIEQCEYVFPNIYESHDLLTIVRDFNEKWGGDHPRGTRIFFSDYSDDPWRYVSVQESHLELEQPYCYLECDGCGHCGAGVPENLTKCRDQEKYWVTRWLNEFEFSGNS